MSRPQCPKCDSTNVVPSLAKNSHDNCIGCGYSAPVREFHEPEFRTVKARDPIIPGEDTVVAHGEPIHDLATKRATAWPGAVVVEPTPTRKPYWWEKD